MTAADVRGLQVKLRELNEALQSAAERRNTVANRMRGMDESAKPGNLRRLEVLDARIIQLEKDIAATTSQLAAAPPAALASTSQEPDFAEIADRVANDLVPIVAILSVFVLGPFTIAISRFFWKRGTAPRRPAVDASTVQRLEQLQQSVDTIAVEVERISEGQRFVTRLMNERAIGGGAAEPIRSPQRSAIPTERG